MPVLSNFFISEVRQKPLSEKGILSAFEQSSADEIVDSLKDILSENANRYAKIVEMIEAAGLSSDAVFTKWKNVEGRLNQEVFGIVDWSVLLDELAQTEAGQEEVLDETKGERARIRKKIPTSIVNPTAMNKEPEPFVLVSARTGESSMQRGVERARSAPPAQPPAPESKEELVAELREMEASKREDLDRIHAEQVRVILDHEEKFVAELESATQKRIEQLEQLAGSLTGVVKTGEEQNFELRLKREMEAKISLEINKLRQDLAAQIKATREKSRSECERAEARQAEVLAQFETQIQKAEQTYENIEDSGLFTLDKTMQEGDESGADKAHARTRLDDALERIGQGSCTAEQLKEFRDNSLVYLARLDDEKILEKAVLVLRALVFSELEGQSKGKIISGLIGALDSGAAVHAADSMVRIVRESPFVFRLSEEDATKVAGFISADDHRMRRAAILLVAKQLFLERNGGIPRMSRKMSRDLQAELIATFSEDRKSPIIQEICELGLIQAAPE